MLHVFRAAGYDADRTRSDGAVHVSIDITHRRD